MTRYDHCEEWNRPELAEDVGRIVELLCGEFLLPPSRYQHIDVLGESPTSVELLDRLRGFCAAPERQVDDYTVVYLTGHGEILDDGDHIVLTSDTSPSDLLRHSVPTAEIIRQALAGTRVRRLLLLLDTCYAGTGGADLTREALRHIGRPSSRLGEDALRKGGSGVVLVAATHQYEQALPGAFTRCLDRAARSSPAAGYAPPTLRIPALIDSVNTDPNKPPSQSAVCHLLGLDADEPAFLPNPRYRPALVDQNLLEQERARHAEQRDVHHRDRFAPARLWFTGRHRALIDLATWLNNPDADPRPYVVTGNAGSGKTALLGLLAGLSDSDQALTVPRDGLPDAFHITHGAIDDAIYAGRMTTDEIRDRIAAAADLHAGTTPELLHGLNQHSGAPFLILVDALDEAADPGALITDLLNPLIGLAAGKIRLLLGTRPYLLTAGLLGRPDNGRYLPVDLDSETYADPDSIRAYIRRILLSDDSLESTYKPSGIYQTVQQPMLNAVTDAIGEAAGFSFLVAQIIATTQATQATLPDLADPGWKANLPRNAGDAMRRDLEIRLGDQAVKAAGLLRPLAYAQGNGMPGADVWLRLADALSAGHSYGSDDLVWLRRTAGSYVVEGLAEGRSVYRVYHQALVQHLLEGRDQFADQRVITDTLRRRVPVRAGGARDWPSAPPYIRTHLATHAASAGLLDGLIQDPGYLLAADTTRLLPVLHNASTRDGRQAAEAYRHAAPRLNQGSGPLRLAALQVGAHALIRAFTSPPGGEPESWRPTWSWWRRPTPTQTIATLDTGMYLPAVATHQTRSGAVAVVSYAEKIESWDLEQGKLLAWLPTDGPVHCLAASGTSDQPAVVVGDDAGNVALLALPSLERMAYRAGAHPAPVNAAVSLSTSGFLATGDTDGTLSLWTLPGLEPLGHRSDALSTRGQGEPFHDTTAAGLRGLVEIYGELFLVAHAEITGQSHPGRVRSVRAWTLPDLQPQALEPLTSSSAAWLGAMRIGDSTAAFLRESAGVAIWRLDADTNRFRLIQRLEMRKQPRGLLDLGDGVAVFYCEDSGFDAINTILVPVRARLAEPIHSKPGQSIEPMPFELGAPVESGYANWAGPVTASGHGPSLVSASRTLRLLTIKDLLDESFAIADEPLDALRREHAVTGLAARPGRVCAGTKAGVVHAWDAGSGQAHKVFPAGQSVISGLAVAKIAARDHIVVGQETGEITMIDAQSGDPAWTVTAGETVIALATVLVADRPAVVAAVQVRPSVRAGVNVEGTLFGGVYVCRLWDIASGQEIATRLSAAEMMWPAAVGLRSIHAGYEWLLARQDDERSNPLYCVAAHETTSGPLVAAGGGAIPVWSLAELLQQPDGGQPALGPRVAHEHQITELGSGSHFKALAFGHGHLVAGSIHGELFGWRITLPPPSQREPEIPRRRGLGALRPAEIRRRLAAARELWSGPTSGGREWERDLHIPAAHHGPVAAIACGIWAGQPAIVSGGEDGKLRSWDLDGSERITIDFDEDISALAALHHGRFAVGTTRGLIMIETGPI
jgi:hypothetical protein